MPLTLEFGPPTYSLSLGLATAEVYFAGGEFKVFVVGDNVASFLGSADSFEDCKEEIDSLEDLWTNRYFREPQDRRAIPT